MLNKEFNNPIANKGFYMIKAFVFALIGFIFIFSISLGAILLLISISSSLNKDNTVGAVYFVLFMFLSPFALIPSALVSYFIYKKTYSSDEKKYNLQVNSKANPNLN